MKYIFYIPDLGPSREFDTEEEMMLHRLNVANALGLSVDVLPCEEVTQDQDWE